MTTKALIPLIRDEDMFEDTPGNEKNDNDQQAEIPKYFVYNGMLFKKCSSSYQCIANFDLKIITQSEWRDEDELIDRTFLLELYIGGETIQFEVPAIDFGTNRLRYHIIKNGGSGAAIFGHIKDLRLAVQVLSSPRAKTYYVSNGFTNNSCFLGPGIFISGNGIQQNPDIAVRLDRSSFAREIKFSAPNPATMPQLICHIHSDFLKLKRDEVMFPLMGHIVIAAFASQIAKTGKQKPVLHLQGASGGGKTFLANLAASFYGIFNNHFMSWSSTANSIESEGAFFRDALMVIDDFKASTVNPKTIVRIIQNASNSHGRSYLKSGSNAVGSRGIRGLILSTGEDFVFNLESIIGRTLLIKVEPEKDRESGLNCLNHRHQYNGVIPDLLRWFLSRDSWFETLSELISEKSKKYARYAGNIPNGMRIADNWALNGIGFGLFIKYSEALQIITQQESENYLSRYEQIVRKHIRNQIESLYLQNPVEIFFRALAEEFASEKIRIGGIQSQEKGQIFGKITRNNTVAIFPDKTFEIIRRHYRSMGEQVPFLKDSFRDALKREGLLQVSNSGRVTQQIRINGSRLQAWQMDAEEFMTRCGIGPAA